MLGKRGGVRASMYFLEKRGPRLKLRYSWYFIPQTGGGGVGKIFSVTASLKASEENRKKIVQLLTWDESSYRKVGKAFLIQKNKEGFSPPAIKGVWKEGK